MAPLARQFQCILDELLGCGLPAPADAVRRARFRPDPPWSWCPRCGVAVAADAAIDRCSGCRGAVRPDAPDCVVRLGAHRGALRDWVVDLKHARWAAMGELLGHMLAAQLVRCGAAGSRDIGTVVVPVPSPWLRARARGIEHASVLADGVARGLRIPMRRVLSQRLGGTQVDASARGARRSRRDRFVLRRAPCVHLPGAHVVLVDDVRTTGATLDACARLLREAGAARVTAAVASVRE